MKITRWAAAAALGLAAGMLALPGPAQAQDDDNTVSYEDAGPVDLSGSDHATGNVGEKVQVGTLDLGPGEWTITASVRLFVPDPDPHSNDGRGQWKNSQGCGIYVGGEQVAGAGGSSSLWVPIDVGKEVLLDTFLTAPDWTDDPIVLQVDEAATVELICFIDQSHGGATLDQREGMVAADIALSAVRPAVCDVEGLGDLLADDEECLEPSPSPSVDASPGTDSAGKDGDNDEAAAALPVTGSSTALIGLAAVALLAVGGGLFWAARRRRVTFTS